MLVESILQGQTDCVKKHSNSTFQPLYVYPDAQGRRARYLRSDFVDSISQF
jgi:hypothetical protein